jgi:hypothetical protein
MNEAELATLVNAWILAHESKEGEPAYQENWWATQQVMDWGYPDGDPELLWQFIIAAYPKSLSDKVVSVLAAGPVEDLLAKFGDKFIDRVEQLARSEPKFNYVLGGVWKSSMSEGVWERVQRIRTKVW